MSVALMLLPELTEIHDRFLCLTRTAGEGFADSFGSKLLLRRGLDADGVGVVIAASVAGAASLCIDADAGRLREGLRAGFVDFVVANLDEALRILKNEIRRALPVSVGLAVDPEPCISAMMERGLQPDLLSGVPQHQANPFVEQGALALPEQATQDSAVIIWTVADNPAQSLPRIARVAAESLDPSHHDTTARHRWLEQSPRYLGRAFGPRQCVRLTEPEMAILIPRLFAEILHRGSRAS